MAVTLDNLPFCVCQVHISHDISIVDSGSGVRAGVQHLLAPPSTVQPDWRASEI